MFISLLTEYNHANSKKKSDGYPNLGSLDLSNSSRQIASIQESSAQYKHSSNYKGSPEYESILQRNLNPMFSKEGQPQGTIWVSMNEEYNSHQMNLENLHLVKRPPEGMKVEPCDQSSLSKTTKAKKIPPNRIRSKKSSPTEKNSSPTVRRRGSFDLISTDEEFDGKFT